MYSPKSHERFHHFQSTKKDQFYKFNTDNYRELFAYNFIRLLSGRDYSCAYVAKLIGANASIVSRWRHGAIPSVQGFRDLCRVFGCDYGEFFKRYLSGNQGYLF